MVFMTLVSVVGLALLAGLLIGCIGIGGVILVPALTILGGVAIHAAVPAANAAYLVSGTIGTLTYWRAGSVPWRLARPLLLSAMPAAVLGAIASGAAPPGLIEACIGAVTAASGLNALRYRRETGKTTGRDPGRHELVLAGAMTGFTSALTGTGGPLVLVPILMWLRCPLLPAIGMAQVIQLPIAVLATAGNLWAGHLDISLALALGLGLAVGTWGGAHAAHVVPAAALKHLVAAVLLTTGIGILIKVSVRLLT